jgi:hypothetical protein
LTRRREALGIVMIALTASTVFTFFIAVERADRPVELLENSFPAQIRHDLRNTFSLGVIARKPLSILEVEIASLSRLYGHNSSTKGRDGMMEVHQIAIMDAVARATAMEPDEYEVRGFKRGLETYDVYVIDYTEILKPLADEAILGGYTGWGLTTVFAGLTNETGLMFVYAGSRDFFPRRNLTITELSISLNDEKEVYKRMKELSPSELASGVPNLLDAPPLGTVTMTDLSKDDTVRLAFSVDRSTVAGADDYLKVARNDKIELVRVRADGQVEETLLNWVVA